MTSRHRRRACLAYVGSPFVRRVVEWRWCCTKIGSAREGAPGTPLKTCRLAPTLHAIAEATSAAVPFNLRFALHRCRL